MGSALSQQDRCKKVSNCFCALSENSGYFVRIMNMATRRVEINAVYVKSQSNESDLFPKLSSSEAFAVNSVRLVTFRTVFVW